MKTVEKLKTNIEESVGKMEQILKEREDLDKNAEDFAAKEEKLGKQYDDQLIIAKSIQVELDRLNSMKEMKELSQKSYFAQPKDKTQEMNHKELAFYKYMVGKSLSDDEQNLLKPSNRWAKSDAQSGVSIPRSMACKIMGSLFAKTIPLTVDDSAGAALIPEDYKPNLIALPDEPNYIYGKTTIIPTQTGAVVLPRLTQTDGSEYGGVSCTWISDGGEKGATEPDFDQVSIATNELSAYTEVSNTLLRTSAINLEQTISDLFRRSMANIIEQAILTGSGTGQPLGITNTPGIRLVARHVAGTVDYTDLVNLKYALNSYQRKNAVFVIDDTVAKALMATQDAMEQPLFTSSAKDGMFDTLIGNPYFETTRLAAIGENGDVLFGDPAYYYVAIEQDIVVKKSVDYKFRNNLTSMVVFALIGGKLVEPRVWSKLVHTSGS